MMDYNEIMDHVKGGHLSAEESLYLLQGKLGRKGDVHIPDDACNEGQCSFNIEQSTHIVGKTGAGVALMANKPGFAPKEITIQITNVESVMTLEHVYIQPQITTYAGLSIWNNDESQYDKCFHDPNWKGARSATGVKWPESGTPIWHKSWWGVFDSWKQSCGRSYCRDSSFSFNAESRCAFKGITADDTGFIYYKTTGEYEDKIKLSITVDDQVTTMDWIHKDSLNSPICNEDNSICVVANQYQTKSPIVASYIAGRYRREGKQVTFDNWVYFTAIAPPGNAEGSGPGAYQVSRFGADKGYSTDFAGIDLLKKQPPFYVCQNTCFQEHFYYCQDFEVAKKSMITKTKSSPDQSIYDGETYKPPALKGVGYTDLDWNLHRDNSTIVNMAMATQYTAPAEKQDPKHKKSHLGADCYVGNIGPPANQLDIIMSNGRVLDSFWGQYHPVLPTKATINADGILSLTAMQFNSLSEVNLPLTIQLKDFKLTYGKEPGEIIEWKVSQANIVNGGAGSWAKLEVQYQGPPYNERVKGGNEATKLHVTQILLEPGENILSLALQSIGIEDVVVICIKDSCKEAEHYTYNNPGTTNPSKPDETWQGDKDGVYWELMTLIFSFFWTATAFVCMTIIDIIVGIGLFMSAYKIVLVACTAGYRRGRHLYQSMVILACVCLVSSGATSSNFTPTSQPPVYEAVAMGIRSKATLAMRMPIQKLEEPYRCPASTALEGALFPSASKSEWLTPYKDEQWYQTQVECYMYAPKTEVTWITAHMYGPEPNGCGQDVYGLVALAVTADNNGKVVAGNGGCDCGNNCTNRKFIEKLHLSTAPQITDPELACGKFNFENYYVQGSMVVCWTPHNPWGGYKWVNFWMTSPFDINPLEKSSKLARSTLHGTKYYSAMVQHKCSRTDEQILSLVHAEANDSVSFILRPGTTKSGEVYCRSHVIMEPASAIPHLMHHDRRHAFPESTRNNVQNQRQHGHSFPKKIKGKQLRYKPKATRGVEGGASGLWANSVSSGQAVVGGDVVVLCKYGNSEMAMCERGENVFILEGVKMEDKETTITSHLGEHKVVEAAHTITTVTPNDHQCAGKLAVTKDGVIICASDCCLISQSNFEDFGVMEAADQYKPTSGIVRTSTREGVRMNYIRNNTECRAGDYEEAFYCWKTQWPASYWSLFLFTPVSLALIIVNTIIRKILGLGLISKAFFAPFHGAKYIAKSISNKTLPKWADTRSYAEGQSEKTISNLQTRAARPFVRNQRIEL
jgi:hypothetical protein